MTIEEDFFIFTDGMVEILEEKYEKYKDVWRTTTISELRDKIDEQLKKISTIIMTKIDWDKKEVDRRAKHVANLCYFISTNLNE